MNKKENPYINVREIRLNLNLTQREFSNLFGISIRTLQNWEQEKRYPRGATLTLLRLVKKEPVLVINCLKSLNNGL